MTTKGYGNGPHRSGWVERELAVATSRTPDLLRAALLALAQATATGDRRVYRYRKAGVVLSEMRPAGTEQGAMFTDECRPLVQGPEWAESQTRLMEAVEKARDGTAGAPRWEMRRERMSSRYTTRWDELAVVRA